MLKLNKIHKIILTKYRIRQKESKIWRNGSEPFVCLQTSDEVREKTRKLRKVKLHQIGVHYNDTNYD